MPHINISSNMFDIAHVTLSSCNHNYFYYYHGFLGNMAFPFFFYFWQNVISLLFLQCIFVTNSTCNPSIKQLNVIITHYRYYSFILGMSYSCLMPLLAIFQLYCDGQFFFFLVEETREPRINRSPTACVK